MTYARGFALIVLAASASLQPVMVSARGKPGVNYASPANWVCRPKAESLCETRLSALVVEPGGQRHRENFAPAANPVIDCFYVYPTVSAEPAIFSDLRLTPEIIAATRGQVGRLTSRCRVFAPIYRQLTSQGLSTRLAAHAPLDWHKPYADVRAAWRYYLVHDNKGRGVVLIGHSQGSILLHQLLADEIDGHAAQSLLVAAFLGGDLSFAVAGRGGSGGSFLHIPLCRQNAQVGCAYVWNSYLADDHTPDRVFGRAPPAPMLAGCANPAGPAGGMAVLKAYFDRPSSAPATDPPAVTYVGALSGQCVTDAEGARLAVTLRPAPAAIAHAVTVALREGVSGDPPNWGLHGLDMNLTQGNIRDRLRDETATWLRRHARPGRDQTPSTSRN